jgi:SAM-dependent methyltransferase
MAEAAATHPGAPGPVLIGDAALLPLPDAVADCVVAFMSLQDVDELESAIAEAARVLVPGGRLAMAITHQANTAGHFAPGADDGARPFVIEGSWFERKALSDTCGRDGLVMTFHSEHRPLHDYVDALADAGFLVERLREVGEPDPESKWCRIPLFLHILAVRS